MPNMRRTLQGLKTQADPEQIQKEALRRERERLKKLPQWIQDKVAHLEQTIENQKKAFQDATRQNGPSSVWIRYGNGDWMPVPEDFTLRIYRNAMTDSDAIKSFNASDYGQVKKDERLFALVVKGEENLLVSPSSTDGITIYPNMRKINQEPPR